METEESVRASAERKDEVYQLFCKRAQASLRHSASWRQEARDLYDMVAGKQWDTADEEILKSQNRPMVTFNLFAKFLDAVVGLQINNRQEIRAYPRKIGEAAISDVATGALAWCRDGCDAVFEETDAGHDCLLTGVGATETFLNEEMNPAGTIDKERRDPIEMLWDPLARKKNLSDGRYAVRLRRYSHQQYEESFGRKPTGSLSFAGITDAALETSLHVIHEPQDYDGTNGSSKANLDDTVIVGDYQWWEREDIYTVQAAFDGVNVSKQTLGKKEWAEAKQKLSEAGLRFEESKGSRRVYYRATIGPDGIEGDIKKLSYQAGFTFEFITGKRDRNTNLWSGLGRNLVDPQKWVNKFFSSILWQLSVSAKGGVVIEDGAMENEQKFKDSWADPSQVSVVNDGAISGGKIQPKPPAPYPQGMDRLMTFSMEALPEVSGLNAEILGLTNRDQAGVVEAQRKQGALAIVAWYFDALHRHYKSSGRLTLAMIRDFIADDRLIRVVGESGAKYVPLTRKALEDDYDFIVDEAPTSVNMRDRVWSVLKEAIPLAKALGVPVPKEVLDYMPLPDDLAQKWKKAAEPNPEATQMQLQQAMKALEKLAAEVAKLQSDAALNTARAEQIRTETPANVENMRADTMNTAAQAGRQLAGGN